jgi:hypothetical protein
MVVFLSYIKLFRRSKILCFMLEYSQLKTMEKIMFWRLHKAIFADQMDKALEVIKELGDTCQVVSGTPSQLAEVPFNSIAQPTLAITTLQDAQRLIRKDYPSTPWLFFNNNNYKVSYWLPRIDNNIPSLNKEAIFLPVGLVRRLTSQQVDRIVPKGQKLFIKPDTGNKIFTGFSITNDENFMDNIQKNLMFSHIEPEEMCVLSTHKNIQEIEWRFWIAEGKVIGYTPYAWETEPELSEPPKEILEMAEAMGKNSWQPDYIYVADFCTTTSGEVMLIEINAASTSGVYNADLSNLLPSMRNTCIKEYNGTIDD